jgi:predicted ester cyclase
MDKIQRNKEVVMQAFRVLNEANYEELDRYLADGYLRHCQATPDAIVESLTDFKNLLLHWDESFSEVQMRLDMLVAEGDLVAFWGTWSAVHSGQMGPFVPTGKKMVADTAGVHRLKDGKIVETWVTWDNLTGFAQLGLDLSQLQA